MSSREDVVAACIQQGVLRINSPPPNILSGAPAFFYIYWSDYERVRSDLFRALRGSWSLDEKSYRLSFGDESRADADRKLKGLGDMGYSGSTFFQTFDSAFVVKSIPRHFEHSFFQHDMLLKYAEFMQLNPFSLLVRITDFMQSAHTSLGTITGLSPSHHIVMENILSGTGDDSETWDLKPMSYFYPERDVAGGALSSEATKSRLADDFSETICLSLDQAEDFKAQLQKDTKFLQGCNAVDYSLFLVRTPVEQTNLPSKSLQTWRSGVIGEADSRGKRYCYKAAVLDFFWAKHKVHAKAMTGLINAYNLFDRQGPMSVTTTAAEYRERFLAMGNSIIETRKAGGVEA